jgi:hypothetical protein
VFLRKAENLSTGMGLTLGSNPSIWESVGLSKSSVERSERFAIVLRFLKISALRIAVLLIGFLPTEGFLSRSDKSSTEKNSSYRLNGLSKISSRENKGCWCIADTS